MNTQKFHKKMKLYQKPLLARICVHVECGFALSEDTDLKYEDGGEILPIE